jgi:hypothetical protein
MSEQGSDEPFLRIVSGDPTPDEVAAVTVLLTALARRNPAPEPSPGGWSDLSLRIRRMPAPGPGAWRNAAWS